MATIVAQLSEADPGGPNFEDLDDHVHRIVLNYLPPAAACQFVATSSAIWIATATEDAQGYWSKVVRMTRWPHLQQVAQQAHVNTTCASQLRHLARAYVALTTGVHDQFQAASTNESSGTEGAVSPSADVSILVPSLASSSEGTAAAASLTRRSLPPSVLRRRWLAAEYARQTMLRRFTAPTLPLSVTWAPAASGPVEPSATTKGWEVVDGGQFARQVRALLLFATSADLIAALQQGVAIAPPPQSSPLRNTASHFAVDGSSSTCRNSPSGNGDLAVAESPNSQHGKSAHADSGSSSSNGGGGGGNVSSLPRVNGEARAQATAALVTVFAVVAHVRHRSSQPQLRMDGAETDSNDLQADDNERGANGQGNEDGSGEMNHSDHNDDDDASWWLDGLMPAPDPHLVAEMTELLAFSNPKGKSDLQVTLELLLAQWKAAAWLLANIKVKPLLEASCFDVCYFRYPCKYSKYFQCMPRHFYYTPLFCSVFASKSLPHYLILTISTSPLQSINQTYPMQWRQLS